ncbi:MAG TPA: zf-HC2 domain-containing protein [Candidatus Polarisedimenticolia bacterium]|jgi:hypothetical protein|nr:zf-HC2 domain-containing protein [Candidatus Polarisedimenticolia bacterium]
MSEATGCAVFLPLLPLHFYSGLETAQRVQLEAHLSACAGCAAAWEETRAALAAVDSGAAFPREAEVDWDDFAARTVARARAAEGGGGRRVSFPERRRLAAWGGLAAAASILMVVALRTLPSPPPAPIPAGPPLISQTMPGADPAVPAETTAYLEAGVARRAAARSLRDGRALLLDLLEAPARCRREDGHFDVAVERARSRELLRRLAVQRRALENPRDQRLSAVLGALSDLLLDVAEMDDCADAPQLRALKDAIERRQVLLRIDLMAREAEEGGKSA